MMIGKGEGTSSSFVNYRLNQKAEKNEQGAVQVSEAIRGKTIGQRNQERVNPARGGSFETGAYHVELSARAKNWGAFVSGSTAQISASIDAGWTRDEELAVLEKNIDQFKRMNENYQKTGSPIDPQEEQKRLEAMTAKFPSGNFLDVSSTAEDRGIYLVGQDFAQEVKTAAGWEGVAVPKAAYTPVTEIRTQHYRWTEEKGIEETVSKEEELATARAELRQTLENTVTQSIEKILTPYKTYEEAYDALYGKEGVAVWSSLDEETLSRVEQLKPVQGAFGALANHLNNFMEEFGPEDSFFNTLENALDGLLDAYGENDLVNQIRRMISTSQSGQAIDTTSETFEREVREATVATYGGAAEQEDSVNEKKAKEDTKEQKQGMSFLDLQRRAAEEEGQLLDELLGKEHERTFETAGDVLKKREPEGKDMEFTDKLRHVEEKKEPAQPFTFAAGDQESGTELPKDGVERLKILHNAWLSVSDGLRRKNRA